MVSRFSESDGPNPSRYVEYLEEHDPCTCGHTMELHSGFFGKNNCTECDCKKFDFDEHAGEPDPDREYDDPDSNYWHQRESK